MRRQRGLDWINNTDGPFTGSYLAYHNGLTRYEAARLLHELVAENKIAALDTCDTTAKRSARALRQPYQKIESGPGTAGAA